MKFGFERSAMSSSCFLRFRIPEIGEWRNYLCFYKSLQNGVGTEDTEDTPTMSILSIVYAVAYRTRGETEALLYQVMMIHIVSFLQTLSNN